MGAAASVSAPVGLEAGRAAVGAERFDEGAWAAMPKDDAGRVPAEAWNAAAITQAFGRRASGGCGRPNSPTAVR